MSHQIAAYGGLNLIEFKKDGNFDVQPLILPQRKQQLLNEKLNVIFYWNFKDIIGNCSYSFKI